MTDSELFVLARALHVFAVVIWIGGVAFVTLILLPALKQNYQGVSRYELFEQLEHRFVPIAKLTTLIAGISGFYMLYILNGWQRYQQIEHWWLHAMTFIWLMFSFILFIAEPLFLHAWFKKHSTNSPEKTFKYLVAMHRILLTVSLITILGAVAGSHGLMF